MTENLDRKLISVCLKNDDLFGKTNNIDYSYFASPYDEIYKKLKSHYKKYNQLPSFDLFENQILNDRHEIFKKEQNSVDDFLNEFRMEVAQCIPRDYDFLIEEVKKRKAKSVFNENLPKAEAAMQADDIEAAAEFFQLTASSIRQTLTDSKIIHTSNHDYVDTLIANYESTKENPDQAWGFKLGFSVLDKVTFGIRPGEMFVIAGRPGNGKSVFLVSAAINMFRQGYNVVYVSIEMPTEQMWIRTAANYSGVEIDKIIGATMTEEEERRYKDALYALKNSRNRFEIIDAPTVTPSTIRSEIKAIAKEHQPDAIFVDYLGITRPDEKGLKDNLAQASVVEGLRGIAREDRIALVTAAQMNRPDKGKVKVKGTERLSRSDVIGATADVILLIEETDPEDEVANLSDKTNIYIVKNRKGPAPTLEMRKAFEFAMFCDWQQADASAWNV